MGVSREEATVFDFSDACLGEYFGTPDESITLQVFGSRCALRASDDRRFLSRLGLGPKVLPTHTRIADGSFLCGGLPPHPTPEPTATPTMAPTPDPTPSPDVYEKALD